MVTRRCSSRSGVTLAELTVALTVIGGVLFALLALLFGQVRDTRRMYDRTVALEYVRSQTEAVRGLPRSAVLALDGRPAPLELASVANLHEPVSTVRVRPRTDDPDALDVLVAFEWDELGGGHRRTELVSVWTPEPPGK